MSFLPDLGDIGDKVSGGSDLLRPNTNKLSDDIFGGSENPFSLLKDMSPPGPGDMSLPGLDIFDQDSPLNPKNLTETASSALEIANEFNPLGNVLNGKLPNPIDGARSATEFVSENNPLGDLGSGELPNPTEQVSSLVDFAGENNPLGDNMNFGIPNPTDQFSSAKDILSETNILRDITNGRMPDPMESINALAQFANENNPLGIELNLNFQISNPMSQARSAMEFGNEIMPQSTVPSCGNQNPLKMLSSFHDLAKDYLPAGAASSMGDIFKQVSPRNLFG